MGRLNRTVALVGMMGAGKSSLGRRLAAKLGVAFRDTDSEVEAAAGCSVNDIFALYGEAAFRDCERKVIARLLNEAPHVLATGGGSFIDADNRRRIKASALSVWIDVPLDVLVSRVERRDTRPLLRNGNAHEIITRLLTERLPAYRQADFTLRGEDGPPGASVARLLAALSEHGALG